MVWTLKSVLNVNTTRNNYNAPLSIERELYSDNYWYTGSYLLIYYLLRGIIIYWIIFKSEVALWPYTVKVEFCQNIAAVLLTTTIIIVDCNVIMELAAGHRLCHLIGITFGQLSIYHSQELFSLTIINYEQQWAVY